MINPGLQVDPEIWTEIKPIDYNANSEPINKYPDLVRYLQNNPWRTMSGHSCTKKYMDTFKTALQSESEKVRCTIQQNRNFVKLILLTPIEYSAVQLADMLKVKVPFLKEKIRKIASAEEIKEKDQKPVDDPMEILKNYSGHDGSLCNNVGEEILTDFEIEETHEMVQEWIKNGWFMPQAQQEELENPPRDRPIKIKKNPPKKVRFAKKLTKERWPSTSKSTQTKTWRELIQTEVDSDYYQQQLFNATDTEHVSEDTIVSN